MSSEFARPALALALALVAALAAPAAPASAATAPGPGAVGLRLVDVPVAAGNDPRAQVAIVDHLGPGTVIHRRIEVSNTTASTVHVMLYAAAATIADGTFLGADGRTQNDLSSWTSVSQGTAEVGAGQRVMATVTIQVPNDAAPGEQYAAVWAEVRSAPGATGVTEVNRIGIRIYLSVGPGGPPAANFTIDSLTAGRTPDGQPAVSASVHNSGGRALDMSGSLQLLSGPGGLAAGPFPVTLGTTLAIGATEPVTILLDRQVPAGPWDAQIILHSGLLTRSAAATITFPASGTTSSVRATPIRNPWLAPIVAGIFVALLLGIALLLVLVKRRRRAAAPAPLPRHMARQPAAPVAERRSSRRPPARHSAEPITDDDIEEPYHWQLGLADSHDPLTELADRSLFEEEVQYAINISGGEGLSLMLINLDTFDDIKTRFGNEGGDSVLVTIAERLRLAVRQQDLVARLRGDTFAILFEGTERAHLEAISKRMLDTVNEPVSIDGNVVLIQASLGVAQAGSTDDATLLMTHAGVALADARTATTSHHTWYADMPVAQAPLGIPHRGPTEG